MSAPRRSARSPRQAAAQPLDLALAQTFTDDPARYRRLLAAARRHDDRAALAFAAAQRLVAAAAAMVLGPGAATQAELDQAEAAARQAMEQAAAAGSSAAMAAIAINLRLGTGGYPKDRSAALTWYAKAAEAGNPVGAERCFELCLGDRRAMPRDLVRASFWLKRGVALGSAPLAELAATHGTAPADLAPLAALTLLDAVELADEGQTGHLKQLLLSGWLELQRENIRPDVAQEDEQRRRDDEFRALHAELAAGCFGPLVQACLERQLVNEDPELALFYLCGIRDFSFPYADDEMAVDLLDCAAAVESDWGLFVLFELALDHSLPVDVDRLELCAQVAAGGSPQALRAAGQALLDCAGSPDDDFSGAAQTQLDAAAGRPVPPVTAADRLSVQRLQTYQALAWLERAGALEPAPEFRVEYVEALVDAALELEPAAPADSAAFLAEARARIAAGLDAGEAWAAQALNGIAVFPDHLFGADWRRPAEQALALLDGLPPDAWNGVDLPLFVADDQAATGDDERALALYAQAGSVALASRPEAPFGAEPRPFLARARLLRGLGRTSEALTELKPLLADREPGALSLAAALLLARPGQLDQRRGLDYLFAAVDQHEPDALACLGEFLLQGQRGLTRDAELGLQLLAEAVDGGSAAGAAFLSSAYLNGLGLPADPKLARELAREALELGWPEEKLPALADPAAEPVT